MKRLDLASRARSSRRGEAAGRYAAAYGRGGRGATRSWAFGTHAGFAGEALLEDAGATVALGTTLGDFDADRGYTANVLGTHAGGIAKRAAEVLKAAQ